MLYRSGNIAKLGRVDHRDSFFDLSHLKGTGESQFFQSRRCLNIMIPSSLCLIPPGHVDFSSETERTLQVLDYAVLVISATDGIQSHTQTLWKLLAKYNVPCFIFVNKTDLDGADCGHIAFELKSKLSDGCVDFAGSDKSKFYEDIALCDENLLNKYYEKIRLKNPMS
ncbi:MAG: GTP-binding protein [Clostridiales bacterium]|nr:GTP-binding protein [Clostridiales bacterium]